MYFSKSFVTAGLLALGHTTHACITATAKGMAGLTSSLSFLIQEDGETTCDVRVETEGGEDTADCGDGYSLWFDWGTMDESIPVIYSSSNRPDLIMVIPNTVCYTQNCCGGE